MKVRLLCILLLYVLLLVRECDFRRVKRGGTNVGPDEQVHILPDEAPDGFEDPGDIIDRESRRRIIIIPNNKYPDIDKVVSKNKFVLVIFYSELTFPHYKKFIKELRRKVVRIKELILVIVDVGHHQHLDPRDHGFVDKLPHIEIYIYAIPEHYKGEFDPTAVILWETTLVETIHHTTQKDGVWIANEPTFGKIIIHFKFVVVHFNQPKNRRSLEFKAVFSTLARKIHKQRLPMIFVESSSKKLHKKYTTSTKFPSLVVIHSRTSTEYKGRFHTKPIEKWLKSLLMTIKFKVVNNIIILTEENFHDAARAYPILVVFFYGSHCPVSKKTMPKYKDVVKYFIKKKTTIKFGKVEIETSPRLIKQFRIVTYPALIKIKDGKINKYKGKLDIHSMIKWIKGGKDPSQEQQDYQDPSQMQQEDDEPSENQEQNQEQQQQQQTQVHMFTIDGDGIPSLDSAIERVKLPKADKKPSRGESSRPEYPYTLSSSINETKSSASDETPDTVTSLPANSGGAVPQILCKSELAIQNGEGSASKPMVPFRENAEESTAKSNESDAQPKNSEKGVKTTATPKKLNAKNDQDAKSKSKPLLSKKNVTATANKTETLNSEDDNDGTNSNDDNDGTNSYDAKLKMLTTGNSEKEATETTDEAETLSADDDELENDSSTMPKSLTPKTIAKTTTVKPKALKPKNVTATVTKPIPSNSKKNAEASTIKAEPLNAENDEVTHSSTKPKTQSSEKKSKVNNSSSKPKTAGIKKNTNT